MKKIIIFDMDGVLFDTITLAENDFLEDYPDKTRNDHKELLVGNFHEEIAKFKLSNVAVSRTDEENEERKLAYTKAKSEAPMYEGVYELLKSLHEWGYVLTINTSAMEKNCLPLLERVKIQDMFDFVASADISKDKVEKFSIIQEKYQSAKSDMLFVTDTLGDIREADRAGVATIAVSWGSHDESYFNREPHENLESIVNSPAELGEVITKFFEE